MIEGKGLRGIRMVKNRISKRKKKRKKKGTQHSEDADLSIDLASRINSGKTIVQGILEAAKTATHSPPKRTHSDTKIINEDNDKKEEEKEDDAASTKEDGSSDGDNEHGSNNKGVKRNQVVLSGFGISGNAAMGIIGAAKKQAMNVSGGIAKDKGKER